MVLPQPRALSMFVLTRNGYNVMQAGSGEEGITIAKAEKPDLILMDLMMPVMDGCQAIKQIKSDPAIKKTPVIVLTAANTEDSMNHAISAGADAFIKKPWNVHDLISQINSLITH